MTTKMEHIHAFVKKACQVKCLNALDFVNNLIKGILNKKYIFYMVDSEILLLLSFLSLCHLRLFILKYKDTGQE